MQKSPIMIQSLIHDQVWKTLHGSMHQIYTSELPSELGVPEYTSWLHAFVNQIKQNWQFVFCVIRMEEKKKLYSLSLYYLLNWDLISNLLYAQAAALALRKVPQCNSSWMNDFIRQWVT